MGEISLVKAVTFLPDGGKQEYIFPCNGGLSILTIETERCDGEYYTPVGIELDLSGGLKELDGDGRPTGRMLGNLVDPRNGKPYTGVHIHIPSPARGEGLTMRKMSYAKWVKVMERHDHHFADVVYCENGAGKTVETYRWPQKKASDSSGSMNETETEMETANV